MEKFNLTFKGEIVAGQDLAEVKLRFAEALSIEDSDRIEPFFSGKTVTLRRDVDQDTAQAFYTKMYRVGIILKMEPVPKKADTSISKPGMDRQFHHQRPGRVDQSWPIRAATPPKKKPPSGSNPAPAPLKKGNAVKQAEEQQRLKEKEEARRKTEETEKQRALELAAKEEAATEAEKARVLEKEAERKAAEKAARKKAAEEKAAKAKAEKQRRKTEEAERKAAEEAARQKALEEAARKKAVEEKAARAEAEAQRKKAEEAERKAAEETARQKALEEAARKKAAEEKAAQAKAEEQRRKAEEAERKATEEAARQKALKEEEKRKAAEEAARQKALKEEEKRKAAEEAARQKALKEEAKRKAAEEAARKKAEEQRRKAEEAARIKAQEEEAKRKAAEEAALQKALEEAAQKRAAEKAAREKAEEQRRKAEEAARIKAQEEEARRKAAEEAALQKAQEEAAQKRAAEKAAREKAEEQRRKAEEAARIKAQEEEARRKAAEEEAERIAAAKAALATAEEQRIKAELLAVAAVKKADEAARMLALQEEEKRRALHEVEKLRLKEQGLAREVVAGGAANLKAQAPASSPVVTPPAKLVEEPLGERVRAPSAESPGEPSAEPLSQLPDKPRKRQAGAPNLFSLRAFRNTDDIRQRSEKSKRLVKTMFSVSIAALLILVILGVRHYSLPHQRTAISGANAIAVDQEDGLVIAAGTQLYTLDRSGVADNSYPLGELGIHSQFNLLGFDADGTLILQNQITGAVAPDANAGSTIEWKTRKCDLQEAKCRPHFQDLSTERIDGWVVDFRTGDTYVTIPARELLMKFSRSGSLIGQAEIDLPEQPVLALQGGLLLMNSATGPGISVFRPDNKDFGQQLDEVLLIPPSAAEKEQTRVADFIWSSGNWWVKMINPDTLQADIYRFDSNWEFLSRVELEVDSYPEKLLNWAGKVLVLDSRQIAIQRFNAEGQAEAPLMPGALQSAIEDEQLTIARSQKLWHATLGIIALVVFGSLFLGRLHQLRSLVYKSDKVRGAESLDDKEKLIHWVDPVENRSAYYKRATITYMLLSLSVLGLLFALEMPFNVILATLLVLTGPAVILALLWPSRPGHIGILGDQLILVDQHDMYHMGGGSRIYYRDNFLIMDDVVVFIGTRALPVFSAEQLAEHIVPRALAGIKIDRKTVFIKLLQSRHPLAKGMLACAACSVAAILCLLLF